MKVSAILAITVVVAILGGSFAYMSMNRSTTATSTISSSSSTLNFLSTSSATSTTNNNNNSTVTISKTVDTGNARIATTTTHTTTQTEIATSIQTATITEMTTDTSTLTTTQKLTTTETVTASSCSPVTGPPGRTYCGPLFDILNYSIAAFNNSASVTIMILFQGTVVIGQGESNNASFTDDSQTYNLPCTSTVGPAHGPVSYTNGDIVTCSAAGFSPPISTSVYNYSMGLSASNTGDTELFLTQTWGASYLPVTP